MPSTPVAVKAWSIFSGSGMIKVLVIDDSALIRKLMSNILSADPDIEVVGTAMNPLIARRKIKQLQPDVITLDVEMPEMDGITFLRNLMRLRPMPVVMVSAITQARAEVTLEALELGAIDYVSKPQYDVRSEIMNHADEIVRKVKAAARANLHKPPLVLNRGDDPLPAAAPGPASDQDERHGSTPADGIIAIGASTGGTEAIKDVLCGLNENTPGIVISQHIPGTFSHAFAERLNQNTAISVCEASDGQKILPGHAYLAPGDRHLRVVRNGSGFVCRLDDGPQVNRHKPSVDVMFKSVAESVGSNAIGILLTGMGDDGAEALGLLKAAGAPTIAQDEASSVVWGMPGEAVKRGHVDHVVPLRQIADKILRFVSKASKKQ